MPGAPLLQPANEKCPHLGVVYYIPFSECEQITLYQVR